MHTNYVCTMLSEMSTAYTPMHTNYGCTMLLGRALFFVNRIQNNVFRFQNRGFRTSVRQRFRQDFQFSAKINPKKKTIWFLDFSLHFQIEICFPDEQCQQLVCGTIHRSTGQMLEYLEMNIYKSFKYSEHYR